MKLVFKSPVKLWTARRSQKVIDFINKIEAMGEGDIQFDLSDVTFFHPFGLNLFAGLVLLCSTRKLKCTYVAPRNKKTREFLESMGFNDLFGLKNGALRGFKGAAPNLQLQWMIHKDTFMAQRIVEVFRQVVGMTEGVSDSLVMSLNELMNNAFDHSESSIGCLVCAQAYPTRQEVRACLMDFGIGISRSLKKNEKLKNRISNDLQAIKLAFKEGVSSKEGSRGLGLARLEDFLKINRGTITIVSGPAFLRRYYVKNNNMPKKGIMIIDKEKTRKFNFIGTGVEIVVRANKGGLYAMRDEQEVGDYLL